MSGRLEIAMGWRQRNESGAEELDAGPAVHLTLERLQPIDLSFDRVVAPAVGGRCLHRENVRSNRDSKCWIKAMPVERARSIHRCNAVIDVRALVVPLRLWPNESETILKSIGRRRILHAR